LRSAVHTHNETRVTLAADYSRSEANGRAG